MIRDGHALILARCYGDEPVVLEVRKVESMGNRGRFRYVVGRPGSHTTIGWNPDYAYAYSADWFARLSAAYASRDVGGLAAVWRCAPPAGIRPERAPVPAVDRP